MNFQNNIVKVISLDLAMMCRLLIVSFFILTVGCEFVNNGKVKTIEAKLFYKIDGRLSEGPVWNYQTNELYWVDIESSSLHILDPITRKHKLISSPLKVSMVIPVDKDLALLGLENGLYTVDINTGQTSLFRFLDQSNEETRLNDGKCDPLGRIWVGTTDTSFSRTTGKLFMVNAEANIEIMLKNITVSNGITWSYDRKSMYHIDTPTNQVQAFDYDNTTGDIRNGRVIIDIPRRLGFPDGMTIDNEGKLWIGLWGGGAVGRFDPVTGDLLEKIVVPAKNVTSCVFGGKNLDSLFITTASINMSEEERLLYPDAGSLFVAVPGVRGLKSNALNLNLKRLIDDHIP